MKGRLLRPEHRAGIRSIAPKLKIFKNLFFTGISFMMVLGSFYPLQTFIVTSDKFAVVGPFTVASIYGVGSLSGFYASYICRKFTYKLTMVVSLLPFGLLIVCFYYVNVFLLAVTAFLTGLAMGPLWNSALSYTVNIAAQFAYYTFGAPEKTLIRFITWFNAFISFGFMIGHLITATAFFSLENKMNLTSRVENEVTRMQRTINPTCGRWYCNGDIQLEPNMNWNDTGVVHWRTIGQFSHVTPVWAAMIFGSCTAFGPLILFMFVERLTVQLSSQTNRPSSFKQISNTLVLAFCNLKVIALMPLMLYIGVSEAFVYCDLTKAFPECLATTSLSSYVLFCFGCVKTFLFAALSSVLQHISRWSVASVAFLCQLGVITIMTLWKPVTDDKAVLFVIASAWAMGDAIWRTLLQSLLFKFFPDKWEAPNTIFYMITMFGTFLGFVLCPFQCTYEKLIAISALLVVSLIPFTALEFKVTSIDSSTRIFS